VCLALGVGPVLGSAFIDELQPQLLPLRGEYRQAVDAARRGEWRDFQRHYEILDEYPLQPYLDYERMLRERRRVSGESARVFVEEHRDSPLGVRYLGHYLSTAGEQRRWDDYLDAVTAEPRSESLRCYYYRARLAAGDREAAWAGARALWRSGRSVDDTCDPLFGAWRRDGQLTDALVWERAVLAYRARQSSLLRYVASLGSPAIQNDLQALLRSYREPQRTRSLAGGMSAARRADLLTQGLVRFSRYDPGRALRELAALAPDQLGEQARRQVEAAIALRGLIERDSAVRDWVDARLFTWRDDRLTELRLRWAIGELDWAALLDLGEALSEPAREEALWRYWRGRALEARGDRDAAEAAFAAAARERNYYGFLSADRLGLPYQFNDRVQPDTGGQVLPVLAQRTALRVNELTALDESLDAHAEWSHALARLDRDTQLQLGELAAERGWYRFAIDAANRSGNRDALSLRFPIAYAEVFRGPASGGALPVSELMAIARRESAFFPAARSSAGARGLMQLLPSTGLTVARQQGLKLSASDLYSVEYNVALGSAYYQQLLERFDGNRAVALAAYNAGPNRVKHWVGQGLPLDAWIETIPYRETRDYVKAVLAYAVVFDHRLGQEARLLTAAERAGEY
jgi:soluble lytic murein transglycosylase